MSDDKKPNLASFQPPARRAGDPPIARGSRKVREILFSPAEVDSVWNQVMAEAGDLNNDDFKKAFESALRTRAMRKLFLFGGTGMTLKLATGERWALEEWNAVGECTVRHSSSLGCETKMVREWLRVSCRTAKGDNQVKGLEVLEVKGATSGEIFEYTAEGVASVVMPVRAGIDARVRFVWSRWGSRTLRVQYPHGAPEPVMRFDRPAP